MDKKCAKRSLEDGASAYSLEVRGWEGQQSCAVNVGCKGGDLLGEPPPSTQQTGGKCPNMVGN